jgi:excisionase family DNA binding protein
VIDGENPGDYDDPFDESPFLSTQDVMALMGVSRQTIVNWRKRGILPAYKKGLGRAVVFLKSDVDELMALADSVKEIRQ